MTSERPPLALVDLLLLYLSMQVCTRALAAVSFAYFGLIADGKTALPTGAAAG